MTLNISIGACYRPTLAPYHGSLPVAAIASSESSPASSAAEGIGTEDLSPFITVITCSIARQRYAQMRTKRVFWQGWQNSSGLGNAVAYISCAFIATGLVAVVQFYVNKAKVQLPQVALPLI